MMRPCADCGEPTEQSRCEEHRLEQQRKQPPPKLTYRQRGYDSAWDRLSRRARRIQPWCTDCGTTEDLTADHLPSAWQRKQQGLAVRLEDVDVTCRSCNTKRGPARGPQSRETWGDGVGPGHSRHDAKAQTPSHTTGGSR